MEMAVVGGEGAGEAEPGVRGGIVEVHTIVYFEGVFVSERGVGTVMGVACICSRPRGVQAEKHLKDATPLGAALLPSPAESGLPGVSPSKDCRPIGIVLTIQARDARCHRRAGWVKPATLGKRVGTRCWYVLREDRLLGRPSKFEYNRYLTEQLVFPRFHRRQLVHELREAVAESM